MTKKSSHVASHTGDHKPRSWFPSFKRSRRPSKEARRGQAGLSEGVSSAKLDDNSSSVTPDARTTTSDPEQRKVVTTDPAIPATAPASPELTQTTTTSTQQQPTVTADPATAATAPASLELEQTITTSESAQQKPTEASCEELSPDSNITMAESRLREAADKLMQKLPEGLSEDSAIDFRSIHCRPDINYVGEQLGTAITTLMDQRNVAKSKQGPVKALVQAWVKKASPFIQGGLSVAKV
jgi:hypothetical protein